MKSSYRTRIRVLRLCSVFEPPPSALVGRGVKFDPIGGMQNHTAELTRARPARHRPDGCDHAPTDRAAFAAPRRARPRYTLRTPRTAVSPALRSPGGHPRPDPRRADRR